MAPLRVLHVSRPLEGGVPRVVAALAGDQLARGWEVQVACPAESELRELAGRAGAHHLPWAAERSPGPATPAETARLARLLRAAQPQVVHLHSSKAGLAGRLALRGRLPTLFQPHGWSFDMADGAMARAAAGWERLATRWSDAVVCVSEGERARGERAGMRARWEIVPNGVDLERFAPAGPQERQAARERLGLPPEAPLAVLVGRYCREKAQDLMLEAWPHVRERVPAAELALVGDGDDRRSLEDAGAPGVRLTGWVDDVPAWLAAATVVVMPSRSEAGSLIVLEAMASARGVVASDVPGMGDAVRGRAGTVIGVGDRAALVDAVAARLADPELADREGAEGRRIAEADYSLRAAGERMAEVYERVLRLRA